MLLCPLHCIGTLDMHTCSGVHPTAAAALLGCTNAPRLWCLLQWQASEKVLYSISLPAMA
jgi:hypothetical protein